MLEIKDKKFFLEGQEFKIYSGAMHYFRIMPDYWPDRLLKLKAAGLNTVETYVCWNLHEPRHNEFDFGGILDIKRYVKTAQEAGLKVILRPGPYICAEWDFGGLPAWLLKDKNIRLRCNDAKYLEYVDNYIKRLFSELDDCFYSNGGNIIAVQIENEYGSYGNDKKYLQHIKKLYQECGVKELLFTSDGDASMMLAGGMLDGVLETVNLGSNAKSRFDSLEKYQRDMPLMCTEFWCGWFDHWGERHHKRSVNNMTKVLKEFLDLDANFNFYMFHGGTNFAFTAGSNNFSHLMPCTTSYDYYAPLNEYGDYTPLYYAIREIMHKHQNLPLEELPPRPRLQTIGEVKLTEATSLFDNFDNIGKHHYSPLAEGMEYFDQNFGMIYYKTVLKGRYGLCNLTIQDLHDRGYLYIDGKLTKTIDCTTNPVIRKMLKKESVLYNFSGDSCEISLLVDAMGRTNYGSKLYDRKGISGIRLANQNIMDYEITTFPLDNLDKLDFGKNCGKYPLFFKGNFNASSTADCFVALRGFVKGSVYVNGFNLGRYWSKGPQKTLYLPGCLLKNDRPNEILVMELENCAAPVVNITDKHDLG